MDHCASDIVTKGLSQWVLFFQCLIVTIMMVVTSSRRTIIQLCTSIVLLTYVNKITYFVDKFMFNSINKYFTRLSPNQIELREFLARQASRAAREHQDARETLVQETASEVINLIDSDEEIAVTNSLQDTFQRILHSGELPTVTSAIESLQRPKLY